MAKKQTKRHPLYRVRVALQALMLPLITLLFLDFTGVLHHYFGWLAKIQFLPAVLAMNVAVVAVLCVLTLIFGRIYCSVICPLGILQDGIATLHPKRNRYTYSPELRWVRYPVLALFIVLMLAGFGGIAALLAPYSAYGRIAQSILQPAYIFVNNLLASVAAHYDSYAFYSTDLWLKGGITLGVSLITLAVVGTLAWRGGRTYCNVICPVGTTLSFLARFSYFGVRFDREKCRQCSLCTKNCKTSAIDYKNYSVDGSRCVACGVCLSKCPHDALHYKRKDTKDLKDPKVDEGRRAFLVGSAMATASAAMAQSTVKVDGGIAAIERKQRPERNTPLTPPGSLSARNMASHCTACQLCVAECPNDVLRPSTDLRTLMQPTMDFNRGQCRIECTRCSEVCPAGAIRPITREEKTAIHIGHAVWVKQNCVPVTDGVQCGNCERHCPAGAIIMVPLDPNEPDGLKIPAVDEEFCIGCGACEYVCPARPFSAIYVEGHETHRIER